MQAVELADGLDRTQKQAAMMGQETVMTLAESDPSTYVPFESGCSLSAFTKRKVKKCFSVAKTTRKSSFLPCHKCCLP